MKHYKMHLKTVLSSLLVLALLLGTFMPCTQAFAMEEREEAGTRMVMPEGAGEDESPDTDSDEPAFAEEETADGDWGPSGTEEEKDLEADLTEPVKEESKDPEIPESSDENLPETAVSEEEELLPEDILPEEELTEAEAEALMASASRPESLGKVTVGRNSLIRLPIQSRYVVNTRWWYAIHDGTKYMGVCARASSTGPVDPSYPDSRTESCNYNYMTEDIVNALAAWQKSGESSDSYPMPIVTGRGHNARLAKAVLVSNFIRDDIWLNNFSSFSESYAAAHLLVSYLLFGDDDRAYGSNYDHVFKEMRSEVKAWLAEPRNAAIVDSCTAYIAFLQKDCQSIVWVEGVPGVLTLQKKAVDEDDEEVTGIDLSGTTYTVYTDQECTSQAIDAYGNAAVLVCDSQGKAGRILLPAGTYYLKETKAAPGLEISQEIYTASLPGTTKYGEKLNLTTKKVSDRIRNSLPMGALVIEKTDGMTAQTRGGASLQGAVYDLLVDEEGGIETEGRTYAKGEVFAKLTTDKKGSASLDEIPEGNYILKETKAPKGFKISAEEKKIQIKGGETLSLTGDQALMEELIRAPFKFEKMSSSGKGMEGIPFLITCKESGASWTVYTGENGTYDSQKEEDPERRMLPYGTYTLKEKACDANEGYRLADPVTFAVQNEQELTLDRIINYRDLTVRTLLSDQEGHKCLRPEKDLTLQDKVSISDFYEYVGKEILIKSVLVDRETGDEIISCEKTRTLARPQDTITIRFDLDASSLGGRSLVSFEYIFDEEGNEIARHEDIHDEDQTVSFPRIGTKAACTATEDQILPESGRIVILDTISYKGLEGGKTYRAEGVLYNADNGEIFKAGGREVTGQVTFTADPSGEGTAEAVFSFEAPEDFSGMTLVAAETLADTDGRILCEHKDLKDSEQAVYVPKIRTNASDQMTQDHVGTISREAVLKDIVTFTNLLAGSEYTVSGYLVRKDTGEPLLSKGEKITASRTFTPDKSDGAVELVFTFDSSLVEGQTLVCFEELKYKDLTVASHADLQDQDQSVTYPGIRTTACDIRTKDHLGIPGLGSLLGMPEESRITDTVRMAGLIPGTEYTVRGIVYDRNSGKELKDEEGNPFTVSKTFTASGEEESLELVFTIKTALLSGKTAVVCEDLIHGEVITASHADLEDEEQSVHYPEISTSAKDEVTGTHGGIISTKTTVTDKAFYSNLIPSTKDHPTSYTMQGTLMCRSTCMPLLDKDGNEVTSSVTFSPEEADGSVELTFTFDSSLLQGETVVCFERLYREDLLVAVHADLEDEDQSIYYPAICTRASDDMTGSGTGTAGENASVTDLVQYRNLVPGSYIAKGLLIDKESGLPLKDLEGKEVTAQASFTSTDYSGEVPVTFRFSSEGFYGRTLVAFQSIYTEKGDLIVAHEDPEDQEESIFYPSVSTSAESEKTGTHTGSVEEMTTIIDHVHYRNLIPSSKEVPREYSVKGVLMVRSTGEALHDEKGEEISARTVFSPEEAEGTVDLVFTFPSVLLAGETVICFETLYDNEIEVAVHKDLTDEEQSVHYPSIGTKASVQGEKTVSASGIVKVEDRVEYHNLVSGTEYQVKGVLMDKASGRALTVRGKEVTSTVTFTPESTDGFIDMTFTFDAAGLGSRTLVAFESLLVNGIEVTSHASLEDQDQTITLTPPPEKPKTGDENHAAVFAAASLISLAGAGVLLIFSRRRRNI